MHHLDLRDFAEHSVKIPAKLLSRKPQTKEVGPFKVLFAHAMDLCFVTTLLFFAVFLLRQFIGEMMLSATMQDSVRRTASEMFYMLFPAVVFGYFFFSNFFNQGQSFGMHIAKIRLRTSVVSFRESFKLAALSSALCLSGGLFWKFFSRSASVMTHDWLYGELLAHRDVLGVDLLARTTEANPEEESLDLAA